MKCIIKKKLSLCLVLVMLITLFAACSEKQEQNPQGQVSDLSEEVHFNVSEILVNDESSKVTETSDTSTSDVSDDKSSMETPSQDEATSSPNETSAIVTGEFVVSEKKYTYKDEDLMLLFVKNQTGGHYDLTINGKYLDVDGKVIKEESKTYIGFPDGWSNYFIFRPEEMFDDFEYSLSVKPCDTSNKVYFNNGEPLTQYIDLTYEKTLYWQRGFPGNRDLVFNYKLINRHTSVTVAFDCHVLVLDEQGEIYAMDYDFLKVFQNGKTNTSTPPVGVPNDDFPRVGLRSQAKGLDETIPENIQGKFTAIFAIESVVDLDELFKLPRE